MTVLDRLDHAVLVAIDMQVAFREEGSDWAGPRYDEAAARIATLVDLFGDRVVWTRFVRDPREAGAWSDYYDRWSSFRVDEDSGQWDLTTSAAPGHATVSLPTFSKWGPELAALAPVGTPLVVTGVATDCCVLSTALTAADAGAYAIIAADACAGSTAENHDAALHVMGLYPPQLTISDTATILGG